MKITVQLTRDELDLIRSGLLLEQRSNQEVLSMLRDSDPADPRVPPLVSHNEKRRVALDRLLTKIGVNRINHLALIFAH